MRRTTALAAAAACALGTAVPGVVAPLASGQVVVTSPAGARAAEDAVVRAGGKVVARLPLANGVLARVRPGAAMRGAVVAQDRALRVAGLSADPAAASTVRETLGVADGAGAGVTVALVDTGVALGADVAVARRYDVTGTGAGDAYGHGTFMAGLIAGRRTGVAPRARLVDVKVADDSGETTLSKVLRGLEVVAAQPDVRVLNLSLSSGSPLPYQVDPLTTALRGLWRRGVVVVVPSGNDGPGARTVASPGVDPTLLTVGAIDENGTGARSDDTVPAWSSRGPAPQRVAKPDVAAPGAHLLSLRAPGSTVDEANPSARVGETYFRGSGTSMATAVTSGAVAAVLAARPSLGPDAVKGLVTGTAYDAAGLADPDAAGAGGLDVAAAMTGEARGRAYRAAPDDDEASLAELARAWAAGDYDAAARAWAMLSPQARAWAGRAWAQSVWQRANSWSDAEWAARANSWSGTSWLGTSWLGTSWLDDEWVGRAWAARAWASDDWAARAWAGRAWAGRAWAGRAWAESDWTGRAWAADIWSARAWSARAWSVAGWSS